MAVADPHQFLQQQGASLVCFHPCAEQLVLGLGCAAAPLSVPQCVAFRLKQPAAVSENAAATPPAWPHQQAYEALAQVHRLLHLPTPPRPAGDQQQQQQGDAFPEAKAGLVSTRQLPDDAFAWTDTRQAQQQQGGQPPAAADTLLPCLAGGQVAALRPSEPYEAWWLMTADGHVASLDTLPRHALLDRFELCWGWALQQLGLPRARCQQLSAVLVVPVHMTAEEVRLLAEGLLLDRLGFAAVVVHLEPVAASLGAGATSACVVGVGRGASSVCCVDDAVVLGPAGSRLVLPVGLADAAAVLTAWASRYDHWPAPLRELGANGSTSSGLGQRALPAQVYGMLLLQALVLKQCYCPKDNYQHGLAQLSLEDQPPAVVPLRSPDGGPTTGYLINLGSWAAVAAMVLFFPGLAPSKQQAAGGQPGATDAPTAACGQLYRRCHARVEELPVGEALCMQAQLAARREAGETGPPPVGAYLPARVGEAADDGGGADLSVIGLDEAVCHSITSCAADSPELLARLASGLLLVGPGGSLRGLGSMLERRLGQRLADAGRAQVVRALEPQAAGEDVCWRGAVLLACLDGREAWVKRGSGTSGDLFYFARVQQGAVAG